MLGRSDILTLHLPGGTEVGTLMTREAFACMRRGAVFVNTARGSLVDEDALIDALKSGQLFAAGLDVFRKEPDFDLRLAELPNVFLTPHMGSATTETRNQMGLKALDNIAAVFAGSPPNRPGLRRSSRGCGDRPDGTPGDHRPFAGAQLGGGG